MKVKVNIINMWCILMPEAVTEPSLMMTSMVYEESLVRGGDTHTHTTQHTQRTHTQRTHTQRTHTKNTHTGSSILCCCCSVPRLNTLRVTWYAHPHLYTCTSTGTLHRMRGLRAWPFSNTPPCRQPHSVFGGVYLIKLFQSLKWLWKLPQTTNDNVVGRLITPFCHSNRVGIEWKSNKQKVNPILGGFGGMPPWTILKSRCKSVQSGAFWSSVFSLQKWTEKDRIIHNT